MATQDEELNYSNSEDNLLGSGSYGTVLLGSFGRDRTPVAVKQIDKLRMEKSVFDQEVELMKKARHHPNILRFIHTEICKDNKFLLIVTELCSRTLEDYVKNVDREPRFVSEWEMLRQLTTGLEHLHRLEIVHRDIKDTNILIFEPADGSNPLLKLADFGISKALKNDREDFTNTGANGTSGWMAPEIYKKKKRYDFRVDIFALGLIFGYILTGGNHPFGGKSEREDRIKNGKSMKLRQGDFKNQLYSQHDSGTFKLIKSMLKMKPSKRPKIAEVSDRLREIARSLKLFDLKNTEDLLTICTSAAITGDKLARFHQLVNDPKADIHGVTTTNGSTPLHWLCQHCKNDNLKDLVQLLIQKGADVNAKKKDGWTPLNVLCYSYKNDNLIDIVQLLVEGGAEVNAKNKGGWTPLHYLCRIYNNDNLMDILQLFIKNGAEVNIKIKDELTPLHILCCYYPNNNLIDIIQLFLDKDADVNAKNKNGITPLHLLCFNYKNGNLPGIIQLFLDKVVDINAVDKRGCTPLHLLCHYYQNDNLPGIIQLFLDKVVDINAVDKRGCTPLHLLCRYYNNDNLADIIQLFLEKDADVNTKTEDKWTPLHLLCCHYQKDNLADIIQLFLGKGADVKAKTIDRWTPLHLLCGYYGIKEEDNFKSMITLLVTKGASMDAKNNEGETPNDFLRDCGMKIMLAIEPTNRVAAPVVVDVPDEPITKDEDATA